MRARLRIPPGKDYRAAGRADKAVDTAAGTVAGKAADKVVGKAAADKAIAVDRSAALTDQQQ